MEVFISTDSRGATPGPKHTWISLFKAQHPEFHCEVPACVNFTSIFEQFPKMLFTNKVFDFLIVQNGYHDMIVPWKSCVYKQKLPQYDPYWDRHLIPFPDQNIGNHEFRGCYHYQDDEMIRKMFRLIRQKCRKIVFIQCPFTWEAFVERTQVMNKLFGECADAVIEMPQDADFPKRCTPYTDTDRVHYLDAFAQELSDMVYKKLNGILKETC